MKRILVYAPHEDRSGRAAAVAAQLAQRTGASVLLLRVLEEGVVGGGSAGSKVARDSIRQLLVEGETQSVEALGAEIRSKGIDTSVEVCWGVAWEEILERIHRDEIDLLVKPASGLGRRGHVFFGATALQLFRKSPCPVWVVGDDGRLPTRVLAAIDPSGATHRQLVASRILDWAEHVSDWTGGEVHIGTAWNAFGAEVLGDKLSAEEWKNYVDDARDEACDDLNQILEQRPSQTPEEQIHLVQGIAHEALPELARSKEVDLIVMGTLGREGVTGDALGETAETIIREVRSSVLTIPPGVHPPSD